MKGPTPLMCSIRETMYWVVQPEKLWGENGGPALTVDGHMGARGHPICKGRWSLCPAPHPFLPHSPLTQPLVLRPPDICTRRWPTQAFARAVPTAWHAVPYPFTSFSSQKSVHGGPNGHTLTRHPHAPPFQHPGWCANVRRVLWVLPFHWQI